MPALKIRKILLYVAKSRKNVDAVFLVQPEKIAVLGISDPYGGDIEVYRHCRDEIVNSVKEILKAYEN